MNSKILIALTYFERPNLVRNALKSILEANKYYSNWHLLFIDDGSVVPGEPIAREVLKDHLDKITFYNSNLSPEDKLQFGWKFNEILEAAIPINPDIFFHLEDDDEIYPTYFYNLNSFFEEHPDVKICYSNIHVYNPLQEQSKFVNNLSGKHNALVEPITSPYNLDISQMAIRWEIISKYKLRFTTIDMPVFNSGIFSMRIGGSLTAVQLFGKTLFNKFGPAVYTGFASQYKGRHQKEAANRHFSVDHLFRDRSKIDK